MNLFSACPPVPFSLRKLAFATVIHDQNLSLIAPFTYDEVFSAFNSCGENKAPGPDGFNFKFYRLFWDCIKPQVMDPLTKFHEKGCLPDSIKSSYTVLIPKVAGSSTLTNCINSWNL